MQLPTWACLALTLLFNPSSTLRVPIKDVREMGMAIEKREPQPVNGPAPQPNELEKRLICVYDGVLNGMLNDLDDAIPFCSSYLGIQDTTATKTETSKTTTVSYTTFYITEYDPTVTEYAGTVTVTETAFVNKVRMAKRQESSAPVTPFSSLAAACTLSPLNATLISKVSSGCSCLQIQPGTDYVTATVTTTKLLSGFDQTQTTVPTTITEPGTTTVTITIPGPTQSTDSRGPVIPSSAAPSSSYGFVNSTSVGTAVSSFSSASAAGSSATTPASSGTAPVSSGTAPISSVSVPVSSGTVPIGTGKSSSSSGSFTGVLSFSSIPRNPNSLSTYSASASVSVSPSINYTTIAPTGPSSVSRSIVPATNTSSYSPSPTPDKDGCPYRNNTVYTTDQDKLCQKFRILCYRNFQGPTYLGLHEQSLNDCIEDCATINVGFSEDRCYGLTYNASQSADKNCFFRKKEDLGAFIDDPLVIAATLIANDTCASSTSSVPYYPTNSTSIPYPTGSLSLTGPSRGGSSISASIIPTLSVNATTRTSSLPSLTIPSASRSLGTASTGYFTNSYNVTISLPTGCPAARTVTNSFTFTSVSTKTETYIETIIPKPPSA